MAFEVDARQHLAMPSDVGVSVVTCFKTDLAQRATGLGRGEGAGFAQCRDDALNARRRTISSIVASLAGGQDQIVKRPLRQRLIQASIGSDRAHRDDEHRTLQDIRALSASRRGMRFFACFRIRCGCQ